MTKRLLITLLFYCCSISSQAQDLIVTKLGDTIQVKIVELNKLGVHFKKYNKPHGLVYTIHKSRIAFIQYENGTVDSLDNKHRDSPLQTIVGDPYKAGVTDAQKYYQGYKSAGTGTLIVGLLSPLGGLIPAIACSSTKPRERNLEYPNPDFMQNPAYADGYRRQAKLTKQGRVWTNWGVAFGVNVLFAFLLLIKH